jgi:phage-related protein
MTNPVFNIEYKEAYTGSIKFETQINSKELGREQRYPKIIYPVRDFILKFDKDPDAREDLEDFFESVYGAYGYFDWTWATSKGGNGKTYTCRFDMDELEQTIKELGFCETQLKITTIDRNTVTPVSSFDFYHSAECDFQTKFKTMLDKVRTAQDGRRKMWSSPKKRWVLSFDKTPEVRKQLEDFFISKRGKFKCFQWTWDSERGGDDNTYWVRFDTDELNSDIDYSGFGKLKIALQEVFPNLNPEGAIDADEIIPRKLLEIKVPTGAVRILDNDTMQSLTFDGNNYLGAPLELSIPARDDNAEVLRMKATISNVNQSISGIIGQHGDVITGCECTLTQVFLNTSTFSLIPDIDRVLFIGKANNLQLTNESASLDVVCSLGGFEKQAPFMSYGVNCQYRKFKDCRCGYTGSEKTCDRTLETCKRYGNQERFGGFPSMPRQQVIKA